MRIRIDDIPSEGRRYGEPVTRTHFDDLLTGEDTGYRAMTEVALDVLVTRAGVRILLEGRLESRVHGECKRCLGSVEYGLPSDFRVDLRPASERPPAGVPGRDPGDVGDGESAGSFSLEEADEDAYEGDEIDLWPFVREQLLLALPDYPLCAEGCLGLCQVCGADLNGGDCGCDRSVPDPRLAGLAKFKV